MNYEEMKQKNSENMENSVKKEIFFRFFFFIANSTDKN